MTTSLHRRDVSCATGLTREYLDANSKANPESGCREWAGKLDKKNYGRIARNIGDFKAHRVSFELANPKTFNPALSVLHKCDNPSCIEHGHLFQGTQEENMHDMAAKGRAEKGSQRHSAKLSESVIPDIRADSRSHQEIADDYRVCRSLISGIKRGQRWAHV